MHINATSIFINDDETGLREDFERWIEMSDHGKRSCYFDHQREPGLCAWEQVFYGEFDGRRSKSVLVKVLDE